MTAIRRMGAGLVVALAIGGSLAPASATAAGAATGPACPSATPSGSQLRDVLDAAIASTNEAIVLANGLTRVTRSPVDVETFAWDRASQRGRVDLIGSARSPYFDHRIADEATGIEYEGHLAADGKDQAAALRLLARGQAWVSSRLATDRLDIGSARALGGYYDNTAIFRREAADSRATHAFGCRVSADGGMTLTDAFRSAQQPGNGRSTLVLGFTGSGAVSTSRLTVDFADRTLGDWDYRQSDTFARPAVSLPGSTVTANRWQAALHQGAFANLASRTLKRARVASGRVSTRAKRVTAVRGAAVSEAGGFAVGKATASRITNGAKVRARRPGRTTYWTFTLTVKGSKVYLASNLP